MEEEVKFVPVASLSTTSMMAKYAQNCQNGHHAMNSPVLSIAKCPLGKIFRPVLKLVVVVSRPVHVSLYSYFLLSF